MKIVVTLLLMVFLVTLGLTPSLSGNAEIIFNEVTISDDFSYPGRGDYDYGLHPWDIHFSRSQNGMINITVDIHNYGLCMAHSGYGWYSPEGRSCWGEWDFYHPTSKTVDISFRCWDDVTVDWRVELDGVHLANPSVPGVGVDDHWKIVTVHDVELSAGIHTLFLGTYQMDYYPDIHLDWIKIDGFKIEAEMYDRMGGNDPNHNFRGMHIWPCGANPPASENLKVQIWNGHPLKGGELLFEDFVGRTNQVYDKENDYAEDYYIAKYIENDGTSEITYTWNVTKKGTYDIYVHVDPYNVLVENDEANNLAHRFFIKQPYPLLSHSVINLLRNIV